MKNIIVNPEDDTILAKIINKYATNYKIDIPITRDNCGDINSELKQELEYDKIKTRKIYGLYKVDTYKGWLDENDFTTKELNYIEKYIGDISDQENLEKFVESLPVAEQEQYLYIPHVFLLCDKLIIDGASDMFNSLSERNKNRYFYNNKKPII